MAEPLTVDVGTHGAAGILRLDGDVTADSEDVLIQAYEQASDTAAAAIVLDFTDLEYMNSGGIGLLVELLALAGRRNHTVVAFGLTEHYRQIFELTRLDEMIEVASSEEEALGKARSASAILQMGGRERNL